MSGGTNTAAGSHDPWGLSARGCRQVVLGGGIQKVSRSSPDSASGEVEGTWKRMRKRRREEGEGIACSAPYRPGLLAYLSQKPLNTQVEVGTEGESGALRRAIAPSRATVSVWCEIMAWGEDEMFAVEKA